jgi:hypothetical protein
MSETVSSVSLEPPDGYVIIKQFGDLVITNAGVMQPVLKPTYVDMQRAENYVFKMKNTATWALADIARIALDIDGYEAIVDHYDDGYIANLISVSRAWPLEERWITMPFSYHTVVTPLRIAARRKRSEGDEDEAQWLEQLAHAWLSDAMDMGWRRRELYEEYHNNILPPSMRPFELPEYTEVEPEQIVIRGRRITYTVSDFRDTLNELLEWVDERCPPSLIERAQTMLGLIEDKYKEIHNE